MIASSRHARLMIAGLLLGTLVLAAGAAAAADRPLGVVDTKRIAEEYDAARDAFEQYEKFLRGLELEIAEKEKELTAIAEEIESQKMLLGEEALRTKMEQFEKLRNEYFQFREGIDGRAEQEYAARVSPIMNQVTTIVERIGKEKSYGLIVDSSSLSVLFLDSGYDLTDDVLASLARGEE